MSGFFFRRVGIRRLPGVEDGGGFELRELASGINVVYGPNGSGKTTTARALEALIWPRAAAPDSARLDAAAELAGESWSIRVDTGLIAYQRDGVEATSPPTAPAEGRDRYRLCLTDLLRSDDAGAARAILIESSGGFDLEKAAGALDPRRPHHRQRQQQGELRKARERVQAARAEQEALSREAEALAAKEGRLRARSELEGRLQLVRLAAEHAERREEAELDRARLATFPEALARLVGTEATELVDLRRRAQDAAAARGRADLARSKAARDLRALDLPDPVIDGDVLSRLIADVERLGELEQTIDGEDKALQSATARLVEEEAPLRPLADPGRLAELDLAGLSELANAAAAADEVRLKLAAIQAELATLPLETAPVEIPRIREGALLLKQWLRSGDGDGTGEAYFRRVVLAGGLLLLAAAIVLAVVAQPVAGAAAAIAGAALLGALLARRARPDPRPQWERGYLGLQLTNAPDSWETEAVEACLGQLEARIAEATELERGAQRRRHLVTRMEELERGAVTVGEAFQKVGAEFGLVLPADGVRLFWLVERIGRWQKARAERIAAERAFVQAMGTQREVLAGANERLAVIGVAPVTESRSLKGTVEKLREKLIAHQRLAHALSTADAEVEKATEEAGRLQTEIDTLLERAGVSLDDEPRLAAWCEQVEEYRRAARAHDLAEAQRRGLEARLRESPDFDPDLLDTPRHELITRMAELQGEADDLLALSQEVGALRSRIDSAKRGHALEDAIAAEDRCREALEALRLRDLRSGVAAILLEFLERETRNEHLPEVFHHANQLFTRITRGAYELRVGDGDPPSFRAFDTRLERGLALDELSSGTRVQLLLAVRLAFVESREAGVRLPLLMDETLANSDDERASAIMDAVIQLALEGRQVFYFTAQPDEVAKWSRALQGRPEAEWALVDLGRARLLDRKLDLAVLDTPAPDAVHLPAPDGLTHNRYGEKLGVPRIAPDAPVGALHLWYILEDIGELHRMLRDLRVTSWGELRALVALDGRRLLEEPLLLRIEATARIAAGALERLRIGRGRPVDRQAIVASGAVTPRFLEEVDHLAMAVEGDAAELLRRLEAGEVAKFLKRNVETLRQFLEDNGYRDGREPMPHALVRREVLRDAAAAVAARRIGLPEIDRLLGRLRAGLGLPPIEAAEPSSVGEAEPSFLPELLA